MINYYSFFVKVVAPIPIHDSFTKLSQPMFLEDPISSFELKIGEK
jgi:hypothetical protein